MSEMKPATAAIAELLKGKTITVDTKNVNNGVANATASEGAFYVGAPEGLKEAVELVQTHVAGWVPAFGNELGDVSIPAMKKHKDIDRVIVNVPTAGKDSFTFQFDRSRQVPARGTDGVAGTQTKYGILSVEHTMNGIRKVGDLAKVKAALAERAQAALGS